MPVSRRQYVYVGSLLQSLGQKRTGIPRVEWEVARRLIDNGAVPFSFDYHRRKFTHVADGVLKMLDRLQEFEFGELLDATPTRSGQVLSRAAAITAATAYPYMPGKLGIHWHTERMALRKFVQSYEAMTPRERHLFARRLGIVRGSVLEGKALERLVYHREGIEPIRRLLTDPVEFEPGSVMVNCGIWWERDALAEMERLRQTHAMRYIGVIYDLSPIRRPDDIANPALIDGFRKFLETSLRVADLLMPISTYVADDLADFGVEAGLTLPRVVPLLLAPGVAPGPRIEPTPRLNRPPFQQGGFVPFVSTLNPRKGHRQSYEMWARLAGTLGDKLPTLVWAGHRANVRGDAVTTASLDPEIWNRRLIHLEAPTDGEIAWLYANATYTIYPSAFEGWGLPVTESLAFGKYCLTADNTSLPQAGCGLAFHAPLLEIDPWLAEIRRLALEPDYLAERTQRVVAGYQPRSWNDVANDVLVEAEAVAA